MTGNKTTTVNKSVTEGVKVVLFNNPKALTEIYQPTSMQFAFVSSPAEGSKQCHQFVLCRDFLHDAVRSEMQKSSCTIFEFRYEHGKNPPIDLSRMRMLVTEKLYKDGKKALFEKKMKLALKMLNHYEKIARFPSRSKLYKVACENRYIWLFIGSIKWMKSPFLISMYTFLIRLGDKHSKIGKFKSTDELIKRLTAISKNETTADNDIVYLKECASKMHLVMKNYNKLFFPNGNRKDPIFLDDSVNLLAFHNQCGIYNLCKANTPVNRLNKQIEKLGG